MFEMKAIKKELEFSISCECQKNSIFYGDTTRIKQVLINLIGNALKFTSQGYVKVVIQRGEKDKLLFSVEDSGIGLAQTQKGKLFKSFSQADASTTRKYGGTGLGLAISKELVELMDGKIWVESEHKKGSKFYFEIVLAMGDKSKIIKEEEIRSGIGILNGSSILLCEDNSINQDIIIGLLENLGIEIDIANNGEEAVGLYTQNSNKYELILMDLQMPIMDGYAATKIIREMNKEIPIVALTANAMHEDILKSQTVGMNEHLSKPVDIKKLYGVLLHYIAQKCDDVGSSKDVKDSLKIPKFLHIDTKIGLSHLSHNRKLYLKILKSFYNDYHDIDLTTITDEDLERFAHTLKGLSANIGAYSIVSIAGDLEKSHDKNLFKNLRIELNKVTDELAILKEESIVEDLLPLSLEKRDELFHTLKEVVASKRIKKIKPVLTEIDKYSLDKMSKELYKKVKSLLSARNFKEAMLMLGN